MANQAAVAILNTELMVKTKVIQEELESRKLIEKAKEILMLNRSLLETRLIVGFRSAAWIPGKPCARFPGLILFRRNISGTQTIDPENQEIRMRTAEKERVRAELKHMLLELRSASQRSEKQFTGEDDDATMLAVDLGLLTRQLEDILAIHFSE
ncbi:MAG: hypothetical protein R2874_15810 [Desulfobacterales bacterium]